MGYLGKVDADSQLNLFKNLYERIVPDGVSTTFTLAQAVPGAYPQNIFVMVNNVPQEPVIAYTINNANWSQIVFSEVPLVSDVIYVEHRGSAVNYLQPSAGSVTYNELASNLRSFINDTFTGTGAQLTFTMSQAANDNAVLVSVSGVTKNTPTDYTTSGTATLTFTTAPPNGAVIKVLQLGIMTPYTAGFPANVVSTTSLTNTFVLPVNKGGTNATDAATARTNLGVEPALPSGAGLNGYVLTTDNSGNKSWAFLPPPNNILLSMGII